MITMVMVFMCLGVFALALGILFAASEDHRTGRTLLVLALLFFGHATLLAQEFSFADWLMELVR